MCMGKNKTALKALMEKPPGRKHLDDLCITRKIILKFILEKLCEKLVYIQMI